MSALSCMGGSEGWHSLSFCEGIRLCETCWLTKPKGLFVRDKTMLLSRLAPPVLPADTTLAVESRLRACDTFLVACGSAVAFVVEEMAGGSPSTRCGCILFSFRDLTAEAGAS